MTKYIVGLAPFLLLTSACSGTEFSADGEFEPDGGGEPIGHVDSDSGAGGRPNNSGGTDSGGGSSDSGGTDSGGGGGDSVGTGGSSGSGSGGTGADSGIDCPDNCNFGCSSPTLCRPYQPYTIPTYDDHLTLQLGVKVYTWSDANPGKSWMYTGINPPAYAAHCDGFTDSRNGKTYRLATIEDLRTIFQDNTTDVGDTDPWTGWRTAGSLNPPPVPQTTVTATVGVPVQSGTFVYPTTRVLRNGRVNDEYDSTLQAKANGPDHVEIWFVCVAD